MEFTIENKAYELKFGMKFAREMDKIYRVDYNGLEFGLGINMAFMNLHQSNPAALSHIIHAALSHYSSAPTITKIDEALEAYADEHDGLQPIFDGLIDALGKSPVAKAAIQKFKETGAVQTEE